MGIPARLSTTAAIVGIVITAGLELSGQQQPPPPPQPAQQQTPPPANQPPIFRTGINFVRVDVIVSDRQGNSVSDLQPGDFDITEDNKAQKIDTFKLIKLDGGVMAAADGPPLSLMSAIWLRSASSSSFKARF